MPFTHRNVKVPVQHRDRESSRATGKRVAARPRQSATVPTPFAATLPQRAAAKAARKVPCAEKSPNMADRREGCQRSRWRRVARATQRPRAFSARPARLRVLFCRQHAAPVLPPETESSRDARKEEVYVVAWRQQRVEALARTRRALPRRVAGVARVSSPQTACRPALPRFYACAWRAR